MSKRCLACNKPFHERPEIPETIDLIDFECREFEVWEIAGMWTTMAAPDSFMDDRYACPECDSYLLENTENVSACTCSVPESMYRCFIPDKPLYARYEYLKCFECAYRALLKVLMVGEFRGVATPGMHCSQCDKEMSTGTAYFGRQRVMYAGNELSNGKLIFCSSKCIRLHGWYKWP